MNVYNISVDAMTPDTDTIRVLYKIKDGVFVYANAYKDDNNIIFISLRNPERYGVLNRVIAAYDCKDLENDIVFANYLGYYIIKNEYSPADITQYVMSYGHGGFPYHFDRRYEAAESFGIFAGQQKIVDEKQYTLSKYLHYSFGIEFETSMGYIPENICFRDGLIPLRDGSISGLEYSTVVLSGNDGLNLLKQQCESLDKYTFFNKECSLHMHFGGYPLDPKAIFILYNLCCSLELDIKQHTPQYTFNTARYKESGKDYCKELPRFATFNSLYEGIANQRFFGDLCQPHPCDPDRQRKWECHSR